MLLATFINWKYNLELLLVFPFAWRSFSGFPDGQEVQWAGAHPDCPLHRGDCHRLCPHWAAGHGRARSQIPRWELPVAAAGAQTRWHLPQGSCSYHYPNALISYRYPKVNRDQPLLWVKQSKLSAVDAINGVSQGLLSWKSSCVSLHWWDII